METLVAPVQPGRNGSSATLAGPPYRPAEAVSPAALAEVVPDLQALTAIPRPVAERYRVVPLEHRGDCLVVAMVDAGDILTIDELARIAGCRVRPVAAHPVD